MAFVEIDTAEDIYDVLDTDVEFSSYIGSLQFTEGSEKALVVAIAASLCRGQMARLDCLS